MQKFSSYKIIYSESVIAYLDGYISRSREYIRDFYYNTGLDYQMISFAKKSFIIQRLEFIKELKQQIRKNADIGWLGKIEEESTNYIKTKLIFKLRSHNISIICKRYTKDKVIEIESVLL